MPYKFNEDRFINERFMRRKDLCKNLTNKHTYIQKAFYNLPGMAFTHLRGDNNESIFELESGNRISR